ncbi:hypothetical protein HJFPF1_06719 [Paramyrothecium foliicola]|nr:hypothetical protein HJFPF1_06719 [Paramyrothecium foliicola]
MLQLTAVEGLQRMASGEKTDDSMGGDACHTMREYDILWRKREMSVGLVQVGDPKEWRDTPSQVVVVDDVVAGGLLLWLYVV